MCSEPKTPHSGIALASLQLHAARMPSRNQKHIQFDMRVQQQHCLDWRLLKQSITHNAVFRFLVANNCAARCSLLTRQWLAPTIRLFAATNDNGTERTNKVPKEICLSRAHTNGMFMTESRIICVLLYDARQMSALWRHFWHARPFANYKNVYTIHRYHEYRI